MTKQENTHNGKRYHVKIPNPNISFLHPGDQLTYKDLIILLDEEYLPPQGNSRKAQMKQFQRMFSYEQGPGRKITIKEIYPEPLPSQDKRLIENAAKNPSGSRRGKYYEYIEQITLRYFPVISNPIAGTARHFLKLYGIVNENYHKYDWNTITHWEEFSNLSYEDYNLFCDREYHVLRPLLERQLNTLVRQNKIKLEHTMRICSHGAWCDADTLELGIIEEAEQAVLSSMGISRSEVFYRRMTDEYYKKLFQYTKDYYDIENFIPYIQIKVLQPGEPMGEEEYHQCQLELNNLILDMIRNNINTVYNNKHSQFEAGILSEDNGDYKYSDDYIEIQNKLTDKFIKLDQ